MMTESQKHYRKMTRTPVEKLILALSVPSIITMMITNIYNLADTYFVGSIGVSASGAVGVVFTLMNILQAVGFMMGHGSGSVISRKLAQQDIESASRYASTALLLSLALGSLFIVVGIPLMTPLMYLLGSTDTILPYARDYALCILAAAPLMIASLCINNILRYEGKAFYGMIGLSLGGILNMIGDPIFIFGCGMGIKGAGLSTALSQTVSFVVLLILYRKHAQSKLEFSRIGSPAVFFDVITTGFPNLFRQGLMSVSSALLNHAAGFYGDACVSAMAITARVTNFILALAIGVSQGFQPIAGFNFQAKKYARLRRTFNFTMKVSICILVVLGCTGILFAPALISLFQDSPEVRAIGAPALRYGLISMVFAVLNLTPSMLFQTCGQKGRALLLAALRGGLCFIPIILILPHFMGLLGVQLSQPFADVLGGALSYPFVIHFFRKLPRADIRTDTDAEIDALEEAGA